MLKNFFKKARDCLKVLNKKLNKKRRKSTGVIYFLFSLFCAALKLENNFKKKNKKN